MTIRVYDDVCPVCTAHAVTNGTCRECGHKQPPQTEDDDAPATDDTTTLDPNAAPLPERIGPESGGVDE